MARRKLKKATAEVELHILGHWLFLIGIGMAVILGVALPNTTFVSSVLVLMGLVIGLLNIKAKEVNSFLLASVSLIIVAQSLKYIPLMGSYLLHIMRYFVFLVAPAATVVAVLAIYKLAKD